MFNKTSGICTCEQGEHFSEPDNKCIPNPLCPPDKFFNSQTK